IVFAVARLGGVTVGMNWRLSPAELAAQLKDCSPAVLFASAEAMPTALAARDMAEASIALISFDVSADDGGYAALIERGANTPVEPRSKPDDLCMICYTSGTTGHAKGVAFTHASLHAVLAPAGEAW